MITRRMGMAALIGVAAVCGPAAAQPAVVAGQAYVSSAGFFPTDAGRAMQGVVGADGGLSPAELGVLVLEKREAATVWRARWVVRVARRVIGGETLDLTEVERFNMGPATRVKYLRSRGSAPPVENFGVGPHVAWRIASRPDGSSRTVVLSMGRRDYPDFEAKDRDCGPAVCTSVQSSLEGQADWQALREETSPAAPSPFPAIVTRTDGQVDFDDESIAHVVRALSVLSGLAPGSGAVWVGPAPGTPMTMLVDSNVGEEGGSDAAVGSGGESKWIRRTSTVAVAPELTVKTFEGTMRVR